jgi:hypothetical protein
MSERLCQEECIREIVSQIVCQRDCIWQIVSGGMCQREHVRECVRELVTEHHTHIVREHMSERLSAIASPFYWISTCSVSTVLTLVLTGFVLILEPPCSWLTHLRKLFRMNQQWSLLYSTLATLSSLCKAATIKLSHFISVLPSSQRRSDNQLKQTG